MDWTNWHRLYDAGLALAERLRVVREQIRLALDECGPGPIRLISICAGDGRDVIDALSGHPRRDDVAASLLDTDASSIERGMAGAAAAGLGDRVRFHGADASLAASYRVLAPADLVIVSGVLGHVSDASLPGFLESLPMLCKTGGCVIWNRHLVLNQGGRQVALVRQRLHEIGFEEIHHEAASPDGFAVGRVRHRGAVRELDPGRVLFDFVGIEKLSRGNWGAIGEQRQPSGPVPDHSCAGPVPDPWAADTAETLVACFMRQAREHSRRIALGSGVWQPTYEELANASGALARVLRLHGDQGDRIALLMEHDTPLVAVMLAVLMAGRVVVPLNPTDPTARLAHVLEDAAPTVIVTDDGCHELAGQLGGGRYTVLRAGDHLAGEAPCEPAPDMRPDDLAFLIYTSGTTGRPKGVTQTHRNIRHNVQRISHAMGLGAEDRVMLLTSPGGGLGLSTTWCALLNGAALCPFPAATIGATGFAGWMTAHRISVFVSSASFFRHFLRTLGSDTHFAQVRMVRLASEQATSADYASFRKHFPGTCVLLHTLSSSEAGNITQITYRNGDVVAEGPLPVGRAAPGIEVLLLGEAGHRVPHGETGEIAVRSRYLSPGYWRDGALTARRLSPPSGPDGVRIFRSGDHGRFTKDGLLVFMGREHARANVHGFRVELAEIEEALSREPSVEGAVVLAREQSSGDQQLIAYVVARPGHDVSPGSLRQSLRSALPGHMIPSALLPLDRFPLTSHGKIDRRALEKFSLPTGPSGAKAVPETETEDVMAAAWAEAFNIPSVSRDDDFFVLGGDSLVATVVAAKLHAALGVQIDLRAFADHPKLSSLASMVDSLRVAGSAVSVTPLTRASREEPLPLSSFQERIWKFSQSPEVSADYTVARRIRIRGPLDVEVLRECLNCLARRHEILRTTFVQIAGKPVQVAHPPTLVPLPYCDLTGTPDATGEAVRIFRTEISRPFDLTTAPLLRFTLLRIGKDEHWLLRVNHHIISDGPSWQVYFRELGLIYEALIRGEKPPLPEFEPLQYGDYAAWERRHFTPGSRAYEETVAWWTRTLDGEPPPLVLPFCRPEPVTGISPAEGLLIKEVDPSQLARLDRIGRMERATSYMVHLAAFAALLAGETGHQDVTFGTYVTNRTMIETQGMFGFFANLAALRFRCDTTLSFRQWISVVRRIVGETQAHSGIPCEQLCEELPRHGVHPPEIRLIFSTIDQTESTRCGEIEFTPLERHYGERMPWGFTVGFGNLESTHRCLVAFDAGLYEPAGVRAMIDRYLRLLQAASLDPDRPLSDLLALSLPLETEPVPTA